MSMVMDAFNMSFAAATRIDAGNRLIANNQNMQQNVSLASRLNFGSANYPNDSISTIQQKEKALMLSNIQNQLLYKIANQMEQSQEIRDKEKAKKRLNYIA